MKPTQPVKTVALNEPKIIIIEPRKSRVWLLLELPLSSFVSLEPAWIIADNWVAGDLYNPVQSRGWMAAEKKKKKSASLMDKRFGSYSLELWDRDLPGRSHQASSAVSHPAVIREASFLGARPAVLPLQHHLSAWAERLPKWWGKKSWYRSNPQKCLLIKKLKSNQSPEKMLYDT